MIAFRSNRHPYGSVEDRANGRGLFDGHDKPSMIDPKVAEALRLARECEGEPPTIHELCKKLSISRRSLEQRFRSALGRSPMDEIRRINLERAAEMLVGSTALIKSIALACGFSSLVHLSVAFRRQYGISPRGFRRNGRVARPSISDKH
jgi:LacI family transcriptional regulator, galactose operon repressor